MSRKIEETSSLFSSNITFINELYQKYLKNPSSIDQSWAEFFKKNGDEIQSVLADQEGPSWANRQMKVIKAEAFDISTLSKKEISKKTPKPGVDREKNFDLRIQNLISEYKRFGHLVANLDPLKLTPNGDAPELELDYHDISPSDLEKEVNLHGEFGLEKAKISKVIELLKTIYTKSVGSEFEYMRDVVQKSWLARQTEKTLLAEITKEEKTKILKEIIRTEKFEQFLHKRFPGAKRFSIEGGDAAINAIEKIIDYSAKDGVRKIMLGMAHRGRLNTLTGIAGKPYHQMIAEFQGVPGIPESATKSGDVKYHMGYSSTREIAGNKIELSLSFNPSHLEAINTVVAGRVRATQNLFSDKGRSQSFALLIHGDAAFVGQGSVAESLVMNGVEGYNTGGVIHLIINNQVGFTANPNDSRSTRYASDLAKSIDAPIFHVNGDDVEAVVKVAQIAIKYRQTFKKDVVIDLICYRRYGHNEGDEPLYTQPVMYSKIKQHPTLEKIYSNELVAKGIVARDEYQKLVNDFNAHLTKEFDLAQNYQAKETDWLKKEWKNIKDGDNKIPKTSVPNNKLHELINKITTIPPEFKANSKVIRQLEAKKEKVQKGQMIDWGTAEALAFSSLLDEGYPVRITGQDAGRGTFSHRHSILHETTSGKRHSIFSPAEKDKAKYEVYDSVLSEYGVLGFEYGYSLSMPYGLTIWEAQFGDFANGAQIIFDQFIASSEVKWLRKSGLVMLLPHGYEGQGPEHSSARLERYLQACADNNLRVCNITTPANFFHALRRQLHSQDRKPLIVMSPKSLLRHKLATSTIEDFSKNNFQNLVSESEKLVPDEKIKKVAFCTGKVYYDLLEARQSEKINNIALIRLEQLYPFPKEEVIKELKKYKNAEVIWCQEEPKNMGSWHFITEFLEESLIEAKHKNSRAKYVGRIACASPATGYASYHAKEQKALIQQALK